MIAGMVGRVDYGIVDSRHKRKQPLSKQPPLKAAARAKWSALRKKPGLFGAETKKNPRGIRHPGVFLGRWAGLQSPPHLGGLGRQEGGKVQALPRRHPVARVHLGLHGRLVSRNPAPCRDVLGTESRRCPGGVVPRLF